jgi:hypothetical protein
MQSISKRNLDLALKQVASEHGVPKAHIESLINTVFKLFLTKMTSMNNSDVMNMRHVGRFYPGAVATRNKNRWKYIGELLESRLKEENIKYEYE